MENKDTYTIGDMYGCAWESAIKNVIDEMNKALGTKLSFDRGDWGVVDEIADTLGIRFDVNGEIVK